MKGSAGEAVFLEIGKSALFLGLACPRHLFEYKMSNNSKQQHAFTLLELIVVISIVGVLASLALPRFFRMIEYSRSTEALISLSSIRQGVERCYLMNGGDYCGCFQAFPSSQIRWDKIQLEDPGNSPNAHFSYLYSSCGISGGYDIFAQRNTREGGDNSSYIDLFINVQQSKITRTGSGVFAGIQ